MENLISQIKELTEKGLSIREISEVLNISKTRVGDIRKQNGFKKALLNITELENQFLIGNIIGDGCLFKSTEKSQYRMNLGHSLKQKEYFLFKYENLKSLIRSDYKITEQFDKRTNKTYGLIKFQSKVNRIYTELYDKWYKNGKKIIEKELLKDCGELVLAIKYFDDGYKHHNGYCICMNDYDKYSINQFKEWMLEKFDIKTTVWEKGIIYIPKSEINKFKKIISIIKCKDIQYKI